MTVVRLRFGAELRARWRGWLVLALLTGIAGGLVLGLAAGARRTETVLHRFFVTTRLGDFYVYRGFAYQEERLDFGRMVRLPQVADVQRGKFLAVISSSRSGRRLYPVGQNALSFYVRDDGKSIRSIDGPELLHGRLPDPGNAGEALADSPALRILGVRLGDTVTVRLLNKRTLTQPAVNFERAPGDSRLDAFGPLVRIRIVGEQPSIHPGTTNEGLVYLTAAAYRRYGGKALAAWNEELAVRLRHGQADVPAFRTEVARIAGNLRYGFSNPAGDWIPEAQRSITLLAQALWLLAAFGAVAGLLLAGQALFRQASLESSEDATLRALGVTRAQLVTFATLRAAAQAGVATVTAVVLAYLLSPVAPFGRGRQLEPHPSLLLDRLVIGSGAAVVFGTVLLSGVAAACLVARTSEKRRRPDAVRRLRSSAAAAALARAGAPPAVVAGVRSALQRGQGAAYSTLVAAVLAVGVTATALTFAGSLHHLLATPRLWGQNFDYETAEGGGAFDAATLRRVTGDPAVAAVAVDATAIVQIDALTVSVRGNDDLKGFIPPTVIEGRAPSAPDEIFLGSKTMRTLGVHIGDVVTVHGTRTVWLRVVGRGTVAPAAGVTQHSLGDGAAITFRTLKRIEPGAAATVAEVRLAPHANRAAALARLARVFSDVNAAMRPVAVGDFGGVRALPYLIAALFSAAAAAVLVHALVTSIRQRRRELAILKTLGFTRRQVLAAVASQATTVVSVGLVIGLPLGIAAGRFGWNLFADNLGAPPEVITPIGLSLLVVPAAILLANLVAVLPGWMAARTHAAAVLRTE